jgi:hypothetical protein
MNDPAVIADADLMIRTGAAEGHLSGSGSLLRFTTSDLAPILGSVPGANRTTVKQLVGALAKTGLSVSVVERDSVIVDIGDVRTSLVARALGLRGVRVRRPIRLLAKYLRR